MHILKGVSCQHDGCFCNALCHFSQCESTMKTLLKTNITDGNKTVPKWQIILLALQEALRHQSDIYVLSWFFVHWVLDWFFSLWHGNITVTCVFICFAKAKQAICFYKACFAFQQNVFLKSLAFKNLTTFGVKHRWKKEQSCRLLKLEK